MHGTCPLGAHLWEEDQPQGGVREHDSSLSELQVLQQLELNGGGAGAGHVGRPEFDFTLRAQGATKVLR